MKQILARNPLFFAFIFPAATDAIVTLLGQQGKTVNEASPAYYFLFASPWLFVLGSLVWFAFLYWLFTKLKEPFNLFLMFLLFASHSWGSGSWIWKFVKQASFFKPTDQISVIFSWSLLILYFVIVALIATVAFNVYLKNGKIPTQK